MNCTRSGGNAQGVREQERQWVFSRTCNEVLLKLVSEWAVAGDGVVVDG